MNSRVHPAFWFRLGLLLGLAAGACAAATEPGAGPLTQEKVAAGLVQGFCHPFQP